LFVLILSAAILPFVGAQTFTLNCPSTVDANSAFSCTLTSPNLDTTNFGGLDFTISAPSYTVQGNPSSSFGSVQYNSETKKGSLIYDFFTTTGTLLTINLQAGTSSGPVSLTNLKYYDINSVSKVVVSVSSTVNILAAAEEPTPIIGSSEEIEQEPVPIPEPAEKIPEIKKEICTPNWTCSLWTTCQNGNQIRACLDSNNCGTLTGKPAESQSCEEAVEEATEPVQEVTVEEPKEKPGFFGKIWRSILSWFS